MGQTIQSHSMHFFELAGPDLLLGFDADPAIRNVVGVVQANPELALKAVSLRKFGQQIISRLGERRIHPNFCIPGGVNKALSVADRDAILAEIPKMISYVQEGIAVMRCWMDKHQAEMEGFAAFPTAYLGMVDADNALQLYDGQMRLVDASRREIERFDGRQYLQFIAERVESWSYLKFPYYKKLGWPKGVYRVGPLARLHVADRIGTPLAQKEFEAFRQLGGGKAVDGSLYYHYARLIENLYCVEQAQRILEDSEILSTNIHTPGQVNHREGVGVIEAPRGTLWHHYWVDESGVVEKVNLLVATGHNNYAMSRAVEEVAKQYIKGDSVTEGALNRVEAAIRAYDPCLSCSTHALGRMPMEVTVYDASGNRVQTARR
jgi:NAD-reducing hydrogenase large subunit